jgi:2-furoyl-CoA dehydrogenase large subunit
MSTPACIANAVADALDVAEISLPLIPERMLESLKRGSTDPTHRVSRR